MDESTFRKQVYICVGAGAVLLLVLSWVFMNGGLSSREFAVTGLIYGIVMFAVFFSLIRARQRSAEEARKQRIAAGVPADDIERDRCVKNIHKMKRIIAVVAVLFGLGMLMSPGGPLLARVVAAVFYVTLLAGCVRSLMRSSKRLKRLDADNPTGPPDAN